MNLIVACLVFFLSATQLLAEDMEWTEGRLWPESELNQVDLDEPIYRYRLRFARKPNPGRFYAPMGKRNKDDTEFIRSIPKGHNPGSFVGLMGKRTLGSAGDFLTDKSDLSLPGRPGSPRTDPAVGAAGNRDEWRKAGLC